MNLQTLIPALAITLIVTVAAIFALSPLAERIGLIDRPGGRKRHGQDVPIIGGIAIYFGFATGILLSGPMMGAFIGALLAGFLLVFIGAIDDGISLPPVARVLAQVAVILIMIFGAKLRLSDIGDPFGTGIISMGSFSVLFTVVVGLTIINAYNLVDGVDGLAGSMAILALLALAIVSGFTTTSGFAALVAVASISGYLLFNFPVSWNRAHRTFMGDAGSTLLGFLIVWITLGIAQGPQAVISPVHCLWFAAMPIFDCLSCFVTRIKKKKSPFEPGRDHFHHVLRRGGFTLREILGILVTFQLIYVFVGLLGFFAETPDVVMFIAWSLAGLSQRLVIQRIAKVYRLYLYRLTQTKVA